MSKILIPEERLRILKLHLSLGVLFFSLFVISSSKKRERCNYIIISRSAWTCLQIVLKITPTKIKKIITKLRRTKNQNSQLKR